ncbi:helix-turn-helix transcriptional regulator [Candidatus Uhrbacteria bacterium]|nr:helix-turn-helix transcriptional regulator [Candidatus Uhrbacteria bacterium]
MRRIVPNKIRALRLRKGWSQHDLAARVDCTRSQVGRYERGDRAPSLVMALRLAFALSVPIEEIFWAARDLVLDEMGRRLRALGPASSPPSLCPPPLPTCTST